MQLSTSSLCCAVAIAGIATVWAVWPEKYVAWLQAMKQKMPPAMRAGADRVQAMYPLSSSNPWCPKFLRIVGVVIWAVLLLFVGLQVYMVNGF